MEYFVQVDGKKSAWIRDSLVDRFSGMAVVVMTMRASGMPGEADTQRQESCEINDAVQRDNKMMIWRKSASLPIDYTPHHECCRSSRLAVDGGQLAGGNWSAGCHATPDHADRFIV